MGRVCKESRFPAPACGGRRLRSTASHKRTTPLVPLASLDLPNRGRRIACGSLDALLIGLLAAAYVLDKGTDGIVSLTLSSPLLSTPAWVDDANLLRQQLPPEVQEVLSEHEAAGTVDAEACQEASKVFYERFVYAGDKPSNLPECAGAPRNEVVYRPMWGPTEFRATGTLLGFDLTPRLGEIDVPVLFIAGGFDEARPETVASFQQRIRGARLEVIEGVAHASLSKAPNRYAVLLEAFLASTGAGR